VDIAEIRKLIKLVQSSDLTEIEIIEGEQSIRLSRQATHVAFAAPSSPMQVAATPAVTDSAAAAPAAPKAVEHSEENIVKSPMVGTFYTASNPDSPAFVSVGSQVSKGDTLCIIEAMKLMNEIEAEYSGTVEKIFLSNASPVEYGQAIFVITPA